jgi:hypothetical protein
LGKIASMRIQEIPLGPEGPQFVFEHLNYGHALTRCLLRDWEDFGERLRSCRPELPRRNAATSSPAASCAAGFLVPIRRLCGRRIPMRCFVGELGAHRLSSVQDVDEIDSAARTAHPSWPSVGVLTTCPVDAGSLERAGFVVAARGTCARDAGNLRGHV